MGSVRCPGARRKGATFGPHGDDDVCSKGLALDDGPRAPQRNLDGDEVVADVGVRLWCKMRFVGHAGDGTLLKSAGHLVCTKQLQRARALPDPSEFRLTKPQMDVLQARCTLDAAAPAPEPAARLPLRMLTLFSHSPDPPRKYWFSMYRKWRALRIAWMYAHWMLLSTVSPRSARHPMHLCCAAPFNT
jgi:hypothetical protein